MEGVTWQTRAKIPDNFFSFNPDHGQSKECTVGLICIYPLGVAQKDPPRGARVEKGMGGGERVHVRG